MTFSNWLVLCNNISQELNDNIILLGNYFKDNQLQPVTTTKIPDSFTPIVCSCLKYPQPTLTPCSYHSNNSTLTTTQQLTTQDHYDFFTLHNTTNLPPNISIN